MSTDQVQSFVKGLKNLGDDFKSDGQELTDTYKTEVKEAAGKFDEAYEECKPVIQEAAGQFETASHTYAKSMIDRADQLISDINALYKSVYGEDAIQP